MKPKSLKILTVLTPARVLIIFILIPIIVVVLKLAGIASTIATNLMIASIFSIGVYLFYQAVMVVRWRSRSIPREPAKLPFHESRLDIADARKFFRNAGYVFHQEGGYAEQGTFRRRSIAFLLGSLALLFMLGCYDNMRALSGMVFLTTGDPQPLNKLESYSLYSKGPLASFSALPYKLKGVDVLLPDGRYPLGAMKVRLLSLDERDVWQFDLPVLGKGFEKDGFNFTLNSLEYDIMLMIVTDGNHLIYSDWLHVVPMKAPSDGFSHKGNLKPNKLDDLDGSALYDQRTDRLKLQIRHRKKHIQVELGEAPHHEKTVDGYLVRNDGIGRRGQIRVIRQRHIKTLLTVAGLVVVAATLSVAASRRRLWLRAAEGVGCLVRGDDAGLMARFMDEAKRGAVSE